VLEKDQQKGLRFRRASEKYAQCAVTANQQYCATHAHPTWGDGDAQYDMQAHVNKVCGTLNAFYLREPLTGQPPKPLKNNGRRTAGPCGP
jgi:hypothetical protein